MANELGKCSDGGEHVFHRLGGEKPYRCSGCPLRATADEVHRYEQATEAARVPGRSAESVQRIGALLRG